MACLKKEREICSKERCTQSLHANLPAAGTNERLEAGAALSAGCFPAQGDHNGGHDGALSTCQEKKQPTKNTRVVVHERIEREGIHSLPFCPMTKLTLGENVTSRRRWHMKSSKTSFSITPTSAWLCSARRRHVSARTKAIDYLQARSTYYVRSDTQTLVRFQHTFYVPGYTRLWCPWRLAEWRVERVPPGFRRTICQRPGPTRHRSLGYTFCDASALVRPLRWTGVFLLVFSGTSAGIELRWGHWFSD